MTVEQDRRISAEIASERPRLRSFVRKRIANDADLEDILQDVFSELVEAYRLMQPIEHVSAWLFRVARNRITDFFRRKQTEPIGDAHQESEEKDDDRLHTSELSPSQETDIEATYTRTFLLEEIDAALAELPDEQQDAFIDHEIEGRSFKELAAKTGVSVNTLISRKHYAVQHLRKRLRTVYGEFNET